MCLTPPLRRVKFNSFVAHSAEAVVAVGAPMLSQSVAGAMTAVEFEYLAVPSPHERPYY